MTRISRLHALAPDLEALSQRLTEGERQAIAGTLAHHVLAHTDFTGAPEVELLHQALRAGPATRGTYQFHLLVLMQEWEARRFEAAGRDEAARWFCRTRVAGLVLYTIAAPIAAYFSDALVEAQGALGDLTALRRLLQAHLPAASFAEADAPATA